MNKKSIKILLVTISILVLTIPLELIAVANNNIDIYARGKYINFDSKPEIIKDRTYVPIRYLGEALDYSFKYDPKLKEVEINKDKDQIKIRIGSKTAYHNSKKIRLEGTPYIKNERTYVPLRFVSEALGEEVQYNKNNIILVGKKAERNLKDSIVYTSKDGRISFQYPKEFKESLEIIDDGKSISLIENSNKDQYGGGLAYIFRIDGSGEMDPYYADHINELIYYDQESQEFIAISGPTDVQFDYENIEKREAYDRIHKRIDEILDTIVINY